MQPVIAVELDPADAASPDVPALIASCNLVMHGETTCAVGRSDSESDVVAVAHVSWDTPAHVEAIVRVRILARGREKEERRQLAFALSDPETERWRATGFAIGTVVGDAVAEEQASSSRALEEPPIEGPRAVRPSIEPPAPWWLDGRFAIARGVADASPALGGEASVSRQVDAQPLFLSGSLGCTEQQAHGVDILRPAVALGLGLSATPVGNAIQFSLRIQPRLEAVDATARDSTGATGHAARAVFGVGEALDAAWLASERFGLSASAELHEAAGSTDVRAHGRLLVVVPVIDFVAEAGFRFGFP
jgi:hypothetical protein